MSCQTAGGSKSSGNTNATFSVRDPNVGSGKLGSAKWNVKLECDCRKALMQAIYAQRLGFIAGATEFVIGIRRNGQINAAVILDTAPSTPGCLALFGPTPLHWRGVMTCSRPARSLRIETAHQMRKALCCGGLRMRTKGSGSYLFQYSSYTSAPAEFPRDCLAYDRLAKKFDLTRCVLAPCAKGERPASGEQVHGGGFCVWFWVEIAA